MLKKKNSKRPTCYGCKYFHITWEQSFPYACKRYEFKSRGMPRLEVQKNSGADCLSYKPRKQ